jgi:hypothetical protein
MRTSVIVSALLALGCAAGCSSSATKGSPATSGGPAASTSSSSSASTAPSSSSAAPSSSSPAPSSSAPSGTDLAKVGLQPGDLPAAFKQDPPDPSSSSDNAVDTKLATCLGVKSVQPKQVATASTNYSQGDNSAGSDVTQYATQADVAKDEKLLHNPGISKCLNSVFRTEFAKSLPAGAHVDQLNFTVSTGSHGYPSNVVGLAHGLIQVTVQKQTVRIFLDVAFITGHKLDLTVDFDGVNAAIPASVQSKAIRAVAARAAKS